MKKIVSAISVAAVMGLFFVGCAKKYEAEPVKEKTEADKVKEDFDKAYLEWVKQGCSIGVTRVHYVEFGTNDSDDKL